MTDEKKDRKKKARLYAVAIGAALGLACKFLPPNYHHVCETVTSLFTGLFGGF